MLNVRIEVKQKVPCYLEYYFECLYLSAIKCRHWGHLVQFDEGANPLQEVDQEIKLNVATAAALGLIQFFTDFADESFCHLLPLETLMLLHVFRDSHWNAVFQNGPGRAYFCCVKRLSDLLVLHYTDTLNFYLNNFDCVYLKWTNQKHLSLEMSSFMK